MFRLILIILSEIVCISYFGINAELPVVIPRVNIQPLADEDLISYRLPNNTIPLHYDVSLETWVDTNNFTFIGKVLIDIQIVETTSFITLHQRQLTIDSIAVSDSVGNSVYLDHTYDSVTEFLTIQTEYELSPDDLYTIDIDYHGTLRTDSAGFYRSSYVNDAGETIYHATTQFESTDARHGFPCYDEPALKANFTIRITHNPVYTAISNMPELNRQENEDGRVTTTFQESPKMSTYLVAFIVSDFLYIDNSAEPSQIPHRSFARPNAIDTTQLSLDAGTKILDALANYLQVDYSLPKMDQVAVPDFAAGAMENWGLVTYRETQFLFDENVNTFSTRSGAVTTIAHEFAHQWFGNLVSPLWWTYLWLNEGFATLYASYATDLAYPDWHYMDRFVPNTLQNAFINDATTSTRPMTYYIESPDAISRIFDNIAYAKSGCVLRMFLNAFTDASFSKGLRNYLLEKQFSAATEEDLFAGLEQAVKDDGTLDDAYDVATIMQSWTRQSGYPILYAYREYTEGSIRLAQIRYLTNPDETIDDTTYWVPLTYTNGESADFSNTKAIDWIPQYVRTKRLDRNVINVDNNDWIIFNLQQSGYYRVQYDRRNWDLIAYELAEAQFEKIHILSRSQLIDDSFTFARKNILDWEVPFNIIRYLKNEIEYVPWASAVRHLNYLERFMPATFNFELYENFIRDLFENYFEAIGIDDIPDEPILKKQSRLLTIFWACKMGSENCRVQTNNRIKAVINGEVEIHQNLRNVMYCAGLRNADENDFNSMWERMLSNSMGDQNLLLSALGCMSNETLLAEYLSRVTTDGLSVNIITRIFSSVYENSQNGLIMAIRFMNENWNSVGTIFGNADNIHDAIIDISQRSTNLQAASEFSTLLEMIIGTELENENVINTVNENILENLRWSVTNKNSIDELLLKLNETISQPPTLPPPTLPPTITPTVTEPTTTPPTTIPTTSPTTPLPQQSTTPSSAIATTYSVFLLLILSIVSLSIY